MVAVVDAATTVDVTGKVAARAPAATVTLPGTEAAALSLPSVTRAPLAGAALVRVTVPVEVAPPGTATGLRASELRLAT
jgi:hypothetical protein